MYTLAAIIQTITVNIAERGIVLLKGELKKSILNAGAVLDLLQL